MGFFTPKDNKESLWVKIHVLQSKPLNSFLGIFSHSYMQKNFTNQISSYCVSFSLVGFKLVSNGWTDLHEIGYKLVWSEFRLNEITYVS